MAKSDRKKSVDANRIANGPDKADAAALQAEVKSFASGLGLAAAGVGSGFDDSDFRPSAARQRPAKAISKPADPSARKSAAPQHKPAADNRRVKPEQAAQSARSQPSDATDIVRERTWNAGVGPRPGQLSIRQLTANLHAFSPGPQFSQIHQLQRTARSAALCALHTLCHLNVVSKQALCLPSNIIACLC